MDLSNNIDEILALENIDYSIKKTDEKIYELTIQKDGAIFRYHDVFSENEADIGPMLKKLYDNFKYANLKFEDSYKLVSKKVDITKDRFLDFYENINALQFNFEDVLGEVKNKIDVFFVKNQKESSLDL